MKKRLSVQHGKSHTLVNEKRGISPLIASVLVIGMVVVTASIVFFWGRGFTEEVIQKQGAISEKRLSCSTDIKINVLNNNGNQLSIENLGTGRIDAFSLVLDGQTTEDQAIIEPGNIGNVNLPYTASPGQKIEIIPKIRIGAGIFQPCSNQKITYRV